MKIKLRKDFVIKAGTVFDTDLTPNSTEWGESVANAIVGIGANVTMDLYVGIEENDLAFKRRFEIIEE